MLWTTQSSLVTETKLKCCFNFFRKMDAIKYIAVGVGAMVAAPVVLGAVGFGASGIAAGSVAAKMMSWAAIANGGGVAAGSAVAGLQSIGAVGFGLAGKATVATVAGASAKLASAALGRN